MITAQFGDSAAPKLTETANCQQYIGALKALSWIDWTAYLNSYSGIISPIAAFVGDWKGCNPLSTTQSCQDPYCGERAIVSYLNTLTIQQNAVTNRKMLDAAGWVAVNYRIACPLPDDSFISNLSTIVGKYSFNRSIRCLPEQSDADDATVRGVAITALQRLGQANPNLALTYLTDAGMKEFDGLNVSSTLTAIQSLMSFDVDINVRNQAIAYVGLVAGQGEAIYGKWAPTTARRVYSNIKKFLGKPDEVETCAVPIPDPFPTILDVQNLQLSINNIAVRYGVPKVAVTGVPTQELADTAFSFCNILVRLPNAAAAVKTYVKCPTVTAVEMLSPKLTIAFIQHAASLPALPTNWAKPIAIGAAIVACGALGYIVFGRKPKP
jgi:hypothetical protein